MIYPNYGYEKSQFSFTSKIYPTKVEIITDDTNTPYLYYEGIAETTEGLMHVTFTKLNLVIDSVELHSEILWSNESILLGNGVSRYITAGFDNLSNDMLFQLRPLNEEERIAFSRQMFV